MDAFEKKPHGLDTEKQVFFYEQEFYVLSNFSAFRVKWNQEDFDTSEAAYHWTKFTDEDIATSHPDWIHDMRTAVRKCILHSRSAHEARKIAEMNRGLVRNFWNISKVPIMKKIIKEKAKQHEYVRRKLLETGERELIENSWRDDFWGWGPNRDGKNVLGKLWMDVRTELRKA